MKTIYNENKKINKNNSKNKNNTLEGLRFFDVSRNEDSEYYYLNYVAAAMFKVRHSEFVTRGGKVFSHRNKLIKMEGSTNVNMTSVVKKFFSFKAQSLLGKMKDFLTGVDSVISLISLVGKTENFVDKEKNSILLFLTGCCSLLLKVSQFATGHCLITSVIDACLEIYRTFCLGSQIISQWRAQVLDTALLAMASLTLPKSLLEIIKRMSLLSAARVCDDMSGFYSLFSCVYEFICKLMEHLPFEIPKDLKTFFMNIFNLDHHIILYKAKQLLSVWVKDKKKVADNSFRDEVLCLSKNLKENVSIQEWGRRSNGVKNTLSDFARLEKSVLAFQNSCRIEPTCFIFEGPPGCFKSVLMSKLIRALNMSAYSHITKSVSDGKDFYDTYNNETIFFMDDVGQQGLSQWRNIINIVSPIKLPLDCAAADLKDTKFFSSELVLLTTNRFQNMQGLTKNDGIDNIEALWRRAIVFDFANVVRDGSRLSGTVQIKFFDIRTRKWILNFSDQVCEYFKDNNINIDPIFDVSASHLEILAWMKVIVNAYLEVKRGDLQDNTLSDQDVETIDRLSNLYKAEVEWGEVTHCVIDGVIYGVDFIYDMSQVIIDVMKGVVGSFNINNVYSMFTSTIEFAKSEFLWITLGLVIMGFLTVWKCKKESKTFKIEAEVQKCITDNMIEGYKVHPSIYSLSKQTFDITISSDDFNMSCVGILSGRSLITVGHAAQKDSGYLTVYSSRQLNHRIIDNIAIKCTYKDRVSDVSVWSLPKNFPTPFKDISHLFQNITEYCKSYLVHPQGILDVNKMRAKPVSVPTPYVLTVKGKKVTNIIQPDDVFYQLHYDGMCGSPIVTEIGRVVGVHVAGSDELGVGVALRFPNSVIQGIKRALDIPTMKIDTEMSDKIKENFSGMKLTENFHVSTPHNSNYVESPLYGVFPITRVPANLSVNGPHTVKDVAMKSFVPVATVSSDEIDFGKQVISSILPEQWEPLEMNEVIKGTRLLAGMNKKSSNGFGCPKTKQECLDFEEGKLTLEFEKDYNMFCDKVRKGEFKSADVLWCEALKDELRGKSKKLPRSFRVSRIHMQLLTKRVFGRMVEYIISNRSVNQIMVGVNPFTEWDEIHNLIDQERKWAGDVSSYDGNMLPQVLNAVYEVCSDRYKGDSSEMDTVMGFICYCIVAINDDTYLTTHSLPSGSFLTAILNSLVNRFYTAMWYFREMKKHGKNPTVSHFSRNIVDLVYGDDRVNACSANDLNFLNAITMRSFFESIGMGFTDSRKNPITTPYQELVDITFLKRSFVYHKELKRVVGPLDLDTVYSTLSWVDSKKDTEQVMDDKISAFQREMYLHEDLFEPSVATLEEASRRVGIFFKRLDRQYLKQLYLRGQYNYMDTLYGVNLV